MDRRQTAQELKRIFNNKHMKRIHVCDETIMKRQKDLNGIIEIGVDIMAFIPDDSGIKTITSSTMNGEETLYTDNGFIKVYRKEDRYINGMTYKNKLINAIAYEMIYTEKENIEYLLNNTITKYDDEREVREELKFNGKRYYIEYTDANWQWCSDYLNKKELSKYVTETIKEIEVRQKGETTKRKRVL